MEDEKGVLTNVTEQEKLKPTGRAGVEEGKGKIVTLNRRGLMLTSPDRFRYYSNQVPLTIGAFQKRS